MTTNIDKILFLANNFNLKAISLAVSEIYTYKEDSKKFKKKPHTTKIGKIADANVVVHPKRGRGRPPKLKPTKLSESKLKRLSPSDRQYYEMRFRNNEASRRARLKCNAKKDALNKELTQLESINKKLIMCDNKLDKQLKFLNEKILELVKKN